MEKVFQITKPEEMGLDSTHILRFLKRVKEKRINLHSFMLVRSGKVLAEGYYKPFHKDYMHRLYSASKTFVALAIGLLYTEKKINLEDRLIDFFPDKVEHREDKWLAETTVEDALKMSLPISGTTYSDLKYDDWVWTCFNRQEGVKPSGTIFGYNTSASFLLCAIVERITGVTFLKYLRGVFEKIGVSKDIWCVKSPDGYAWGGSGVVCTMRDFAKVGQLILNKGAWKGKQLISREYIERMISKQIANCNNNLFSSRKSCGYGYQTWITDCGFCVTGLGSQLVFGFPDKEFMFVCNGDTQASGDYAGDYLYDLVKYELYENLCDCVLPETKYGQLVDTLEKLQLDGAWGENSSPFKEEINGAVYTLRDNPMGWKNFSLSFEENGGVLRYENARGKKEIPFAMNEFLQTKFPETHYFDTQIGVAGNREFHCLSAGTWVEEKKFLLRVYITDNCLGNVFITFGFKGNEVGIGMQKIGEFYLNDYVGLTGGEKTN